MNAADACAGDELGARVLRGVHSASRTLRGQALRTPVMSSSSLDARLGARVLFKCENLQRVGAFKFRGAYNALSQLGPDAQARGVLTYSSGNHAQAVALAGRLLDIAVCVVMPVNAPRVKRAAAEGYGAEVIDYDPAQRAREDIARELAQQRGSVVIPPYDHVDVIAGQGTTAVELLAQAASLDMLLVPTGGAGLLSGCAVALAHLRPGCQVIGVEPELADDATRSFRSGTLHEVHNPPTIADGVRTPRLGELTFPLVRRYVHDMCTVSEDAIVAAVLWLLQRMKLVVEPAGALGLAALLSGAVRPAPHTGVILSGGNVDPDTMRRILASG